jgi:hypothetical protein
MIEIANGDKNVTNGNTRTATFNHDPKNCKNPSSCHYLISVFFPDSNGPMKTSF